MEDFKKKFSEAVEQATIDTPSAHATTKFDDVLEGFVESIKKIPWLDGMIEYEDIGSLSRRALVTWPKYRRNQRSIMITFFPHGEQIRVLAGSDQTLPTRAALGEYLVDFLRNSAFPSTIKIYQSLSDEDCDGVLRTTGLFKMSREDTLVALDSANQKLLAETPIGELVTIKAKLQPKLRSTSSYDSRTEYLALESGGYAMKIKRHQKESNYIVLQGSAIDFKAP